MTKENSYGTDRKTAAVAGVLFIIGTVSGVLMLPVVGPILNAPDHLATIATHEGQMIICSAQLFYNPVQLLLAGYLRADVAAHP